MYARQRVLFNVARLSPRSVTGRYRDVTNDLRMIGFRRCAEVLSRDRGSDFFRMMEEVHFTSFLRDLGDCLTCCLSDVWDAGACGSGRLIRGRVSGSESGEAKRRVEKRDRSPTNTRIKKIPRLGTHRFGTPGISPNCQRARECVQHNFSLGRKDHVSSG